MRARNEAKYLVLLASAIVESMGPDWKPSKRGLAVERAVKTYFEVWPMHR